MRNGRIADQHVHPGSVACCFAAFALGSLWTVPSRPAAAADRPAAAVATTPAAAEGLRLFQDKVRPLLTAHCLDCHGGKSVKGDFDLSTRDKLMNSGFVEPTAAASYLIELIEHRADPKMPFQKPKLADAEIALIRKWIDLGAPYDQPLASGAEANATKPEMVVTDEDRQYWAFRPLSEIGPPTLTGDNWSRTPIDQFVLAKQREAGLTPNGSAERRVLIRRAYFALLGLPPTPDEVDAFVNDTDPQAWGNLVDRLLESEHYGERWARHWLDIARFAESHGYEQDYDRPHAYHYRDFLIKALNADMPFDQFTRWQLAGDELAPDDPLALMATGFLGAGAFPTQLTEMEFESARYDELDDMVGTTGVAFLGLSIGCARCHDHKFDPIPARDYYRLAAAFATTIRSEIELDLDPEGNVRKREAFAAQQAERRALLATYEQDQLPTAFDRWLVGYDPQTRTTAPAPADRNADPRNQVSPGSQVSVDPSLGVWTILDGIPSSTGTKKYEPQSDGSWLATEKAPDKETVTLKSKLPRGEYRAIRLEALTHDSLPQKGPGRAPNGNFALGQIQLAIKAGDAERPIALSAARATHQQDAASLAVAASIDADPITGWAVDGGGIGHDQAAVFDFAEPLTSDGQSELVVTLGFSHPNKQHSLGRFRLCVTDASTPAATLGETGPGADVVAALALLKQPGDDADRQPARQTALQWFRTQLPEWRRLQQAIDDHAKAGDGVVLTKVMVTSEGFPHMSHHADGRGFPHFYADVHRLTRGDVHQKQEVSPAGYLQVLMQPGRKSEDWQRPPPADWTRTSYRRTALADWITDVDHGAGALLARVIVNRLWQHHFGSGLVATPNDFGFSGDKPSHPELLDWLAHDLVTHGWKLKRLHKLLLTSSVFLQNGDFDEARAAIDRENRLLWRRAPQRLEAEPIRDAMLTVSGRLDRALYGPGTLDPNMRRRSVYFFIKRSQLIPSMMLFDWPEHLVSIGQRATTTVAPQALMFLNSPQGRADAEQFAARLKDLDDAAAVTRAYRLALGRSPSDEELALAVGFLQTTNAADDARQRARVDLCQAIFGMNEFLYVE
jgi:mono/diheme cytochrome c family protein